VLEWSHQLRLMRKDFDRWNKLKKQVHKRDDSVRFHEREIWWCAVGVNIGSEQDGVTERFERPVVVVKNFNGRVLWAVPLTRTYRTPSPYYFPLWKDAECRLHSCRHPCEGSRTESARPLPQRSSGVAEGRSDAGATVE
jgi:hypothetical protein